MAHIEIYTTSLCGYCMRAKALLDSKKVSYKEIRVDGDPALRAAMAQKAGQRTVPQIWINRQHVGGCSELMALDAGGDLDRLLAS